MKNILILLILTIFMVSCASNSGTKSKLASANVSKGAKLALADKDSSEKVICKQSRTMGSNRITTVCRSESEIEAVRNATQADLLRTQGLQTGPGGANQ